MDTHWANGQRQTATLNHVENEAKNNPSKEFQTVNGDRNSTTGPNLCNIYYNNDNNKK